MKVALLGAWLVLPIGAWAYHEGPGQDRMKLDEVDAIVREAHGFTTVERWTDAVEAYERALATLPGEREDAARRIRLELDKARMLAAELPAAHADLQGLVRELLDDPGADAELLDGARAALANSQYYLTWLMRLEGLPREQWEPEIEASRQTYRLLAERAEARGDSELAQQSKKDLESAIRLERMDLKELQGLPLPSQ